MKDRAEIVVIGAGIAGASIAMHLAKLGRRDVLVLEQGELISGTTSHAPGLIGQLRSSASLVRMLQDSVALYGTLDVDGVPGFQPCGSLRIASSDERLAELRGQHAFAKKCGLETQLLSPAETLELFPLMNPSGVRGAIYMPTDGSATAPILAQAMIRAAESLGVEFAPQTRVGGVETSRGAVAAVQTDRGRVETQTLVIATGIWSPTVGQLAGISIPLVPMHHQYVETVAIPDLADRQLPNLRDPDNLFYVRQKGDMLVVGGYERDPRPFSATVPGSANPSVRTFDADHFEPLRSAAARRVPVLDQVAVACGVNGLESFTFDGRFLIGPAPALRGAWVASGFCAHGVSGAGGVGKALAEWIVAGQPTLDLTEMMLSRAGQQSLDREEVTRLACQIYSTYYDVTDTTAVDPAH